MQSYNRSFDIKCLRGREKNWRKLRYDNERSNENEARNGAIFIAFDKTQFLFFGKIKKLAFLRDPSDNATKAKDIIEIMLWN